MTLRISNRDARRVWLHLQDMAAPPGGALTRAGLAQIIERLGMVQLDPLRVVARAHDHILWSRNTAYRPHMLEKLLAKDRAVFEHFTHDAAVLPMGIYPLWQRRRGQITAQMERGAWGSDLPPETERAAIRERIARDGPCCSRDFEGGTVRDGEVWRRSSHRVALDFMWHEGSLATSHRRNFSKFFDLAERVIPDDTRSDARSDAEQRHWLCCSAIARLGFGTENEIKSFYDAASIAEVKAEAERGGWWQPVEIESADGTLIPALARPDIEAMLAEVPAPSQRLRIVNPFDPIARDRNRAKRLFGFDYRIEIYTPAAKRQYGYYVYPLLECDRFVGRAELRHDRASGVFSIENLWPEPGVAFGSGRMARFEMEIARMAKFVGAEETVWKL